MNRDELAVAKWSFHDIAATLAVIAFAVALTQSSGLGCQHVNADESSFILMGSDVASGHLPFVHLFDLKPPVIFLLIGGVIATFGKSLLAIRLLGDLFIVATAAMTCLVARRMTGMAAAIAGALVYVSLASMDYGQATLTEYPATAFLMTAVWLLCRPPVSNRGATLAGLLVALAVLTRTNLFPVPAGIGLLLLLANRLAPSLVSRRAWLAFGLGGLAPVAVLCLVYAAAGELVILKLAMIDVPMAYSGQLGPIELLKSHIEQYYVFITIQPLVFIPATLLGLLGAILAAVKAMRIRDRHLRWKLAVIAIVFVCIGASLMTGGAAYPHYWLQFMPLMGVLCALALSAMDRLALPAVVAALVGAVPLASAVAAQFGKQTSFAAPGRKCDIDAAADHIRASGIEKPRIWAWYNHLVLWRLDAQQLSRAGVHPDNLGRDAIIDTLVRGRYVAGDEIGRIMRDPPDFVVTDSGERGIGWLREDGRPADRWLAENYRLDGKFGQVLVYRRKTAANPDVAARRPEPAGVDRAIP